MHHQCQCRLHQMVPLYLEISMVDHMIWGLKNLSVIMDRMDILESLRQNLSLRSLDRLIWIMHLQQLFLLHILNLGHQHCHRVQIRVHNLTSFRRGSHPLSFPLWVGTAPRSTVRKVLIQFLFHLPPLHVLWLHLHHRATGRQTIAVRYPLFRQTLKPIHTGLIWAWVTAKLFSQSLKTQRKARKDLEA